MATTRIQSGGVTAQSITHDKLHTDMNLSTKTVVLPALSQTLVTAITHSNGAVAEGLKLTTNGTYSSSNSEEAGPAISFGQFNALYPTWKTGQISGIRDGSNWNGSLSFWTNNGSSETDISEKLRIGSNGEVTLKSTGVVTLKAAPLSSTYGAGFNFMTVTGTSSSPYTSTIGFSNYSNTDAMVIQGTKVGIGTDVPTRNLTVKAGSGQEGIELIDADESLFLIQKSGTSTNTSYVSMLSEGDTTVRLHADNVSYFNGGNVGIGTTAPGKLLTLSRATEAQNEQLEFRNVGGISDGNFDGIKWSQGATGSTMLAEQRINYYNSGVVDMSFNLRNEDSVLYLKAGGNVGIGTNNPIETLDVDGSIQSRLGPRYYLVSKQLTNAVGGGSATKYILIRKTSTAGGSKFVGRISATRTEGVSANNHAILDIGYDINSNNQYPKFYLEYLSGWASANYQGLTARFVSLDWDDGNGSASWHAIELSSSASANWPADLDYMSFQGYQINVGDLQVISDDTGSYNAISNIVSLGRGGTKSIMHTNVGIGASEPVAKLHIWNEQGGDATDKATMLSEAVMKIQPHATNSTNMLFAQVDGGNSMGIQVTNGPATANWDLALSPFGGHVGIGQVDPIRRLSVVGPSGTSVVQSIRNPSTSWGEYALTRYGTEGDEFRYMDFGYYRGSSELNRGLVIKSQAGANLVHFFDSGKVGIKTEPIGSFNVVGTSTIYNGYADPDLTVVNGNGHSSAASGEISMVHCFQGTGAANDLFEFQYDASSWKSFGFEIDISTAGSGWGKVQGGGYNNGGVSGQYSISGNKITAFAFDNVSGNSQAHILRCTFGGGVHHTVRVKYWQGGGDGGPRADRATMRFIS
jgi:hypothetical protein